MKQIFVSGMLEEGSLVDLDEKTAHHLFDVLRTSSKETIRIVDASGRVFSGHLIRKNCVQADSLLETDTVPGPELTLCAALIKSDRFEWMLQKAAELGVSRIVPFFSRNTVVFLDDKKMARKLERWNSILLSACRQSNRTDLVRLEAPCRLEDLGKYLGERSLMAWEKETGSHHLALELAGNWNSATFVIGPEGGFHEQEAMDLEAMGFVPVSLGPRILRAETAACYLLSAADCAWMLAHQNGGEDCR